jgi:hypothetical protein
MPRICNRAVLVLVAIVLAAAGCLDLDGYHMQDDGGPDAADAANATDAADASDGGARD